MVPPVPDTHGAKLNATVACQFQFAFAPFERQTLKFNVYDVQDRLLAYCLVASDALVFSPKDQLGFKLVPSTSNTAKIRPGLAVLLVRKDQVELEREVLLHTCVKRMMMAMLIYSLPLRACSRKGWN
jgi:hypothetical protein